MPPRRPLLALLTAVALSVPSVARPQTDDITEKARVLYNQGRAALYAGRPEAARLVLQRSMDLRPTPQVAFALGEAELDMGLYVEAANHMLPYMRQAPAPSVADRKAFADAEKHVAHIYMDVNVEGARIYLDDNSLGKWPFVFQPVYALAGRHEVRAVCDRFREVRQTYDVIAGRRTDVKIVLEREIPAAGAPAVSSSAQPDAAVGSALGSSWRPPDPPPPSHEPTSVWREPRTIVLGTGAGLTLAAAVVAVVAASQASSAGSDAEAAAATLGDRHACVNAAATAACANLAELDDKHRSAIHLMRGAALGAGILGAATLVTWLAWRPNSTVQVSPQATPNMAGLAIGGVLP